MPSQSNSSTQASTTLWPPTSQTQAKVRAAQCALWCLNDEIEYATARLSLLRTSSQQLSDFIKIHSSAESDSAEDLSSSDWLELGSKTRGLGDPSSIRSCPNCASLERQNAVPNPIVSAAVSRSRSHRLPSRTGLDTASVPPPPYESRSTVKSRGLATPDESSSSDEHLGDSRGARASRAKRCTLRIYGENTAYHKVSFSYRVTVGELAKKMKAKLEDTQLEDGNDYRLYLLDNGKGMESFKFSFT